MGTTTLKMVVNLVEKSVVFMTNMILLMGHRIEAGRVPGGYSRYMTSLAEVIERGIRTWLAEQKLLTVRFELFDPTTDKAYEICLVDLTYSTDPSPTEEAVRPPVAQLEELFTKLEKLPEGAKFRIMAHNAPGYSKVEGWEPSQPKELWGGAKEEHKVGERFGYSHIDGSATYVISNWQKHRTDIPQ